MELIPNLTLSETGRRVRTIPPARTAADPTLTDEGRFVNAGVKAELGLTAKLTLTSGVTLDAAVNPDFAQVEADQLVVTVRPTDALSFSADYARSRLVRDDTKRVAFDQTLYSLRAVYQCTRFTSARARMDYDTLQARAYGQFHFGWARTPARPFTSATTMT